MTWFSARPASNDRHVVTAKRPVPTSTVIAPSDTTLDESFEDESPNLWSPSKSSAEDDALWNQKLDEHLSQNRVVANNRSKNHRISKLQEKRSTEKKPSSASPHPMSKSRFIVGKSQPNHKRPAEEDAEDGSPEEKRMRIIDEESKSNNSHSISYLGVVVVAIAAAVVLTLRRRRA